MLSWFGVCGIRDVWIIIAELVDCGRTLVGLCSDNFSRFGFLCCVSWILPMPQSLMNFSFSLLFFFLVLTQNPQFIAIKEKKRDKTFPLSFFFHSLSFSKPNMPPKKSYSLETEVVNYQSNDQYNSSVPPLYLTATFKQPSVTNMGEYDYTRSGNPTRTHLQNHLSKIMKAEHVYAVTSGMTCLDVITKLLKPGDEVIAGEDLYGGTDRLLGYLNNKGDIKVKHIDTTNTDEVISAITEKTANDIFGIPY